MSLFDTPGGWLGDNPGGRLGDSWPVVSCLAVGAACFVHAGGPVWLLAAGISTALITKNRWTVTAVLALVASVLSAHAWTGLDRPFSGTVDGVATVVRDPQLVNHATRAEVRMNGRHYLVWAYGSVGYQLRGVAAGDVIAVEGTARPLSGISVASYRRRHVIARINATSIALVNDGTAPAQIANGVRGLIERGAQSMPAEEHTLLTGFVYGDDRGESAQTKSDFQASGLSHLLAVSGENVAFVLLLMAPLLKRFGMHGRLIGGLVVLGLFGIVTRWEPSVVRAEMMAAVALIAVFLGRPVSTWRCLALGSMAAMLCDPFLVGSVGFLLSVSACFGMALLGRSIATILRGPAWVRRAIAYSAAAQIGVAPVQVAVFNSLPVVSLLTNVAAEPIAGFVMVWGIVGGLAAGIVPFADLRVLLHVPDLLALYVLRYIAHCGAWMEASTWGKAAAVLLSVTTSLAFLAPTRGSCE